jgi:hypothetical protein
VPKLIPWKIPFNGLPELPDGAGLSKVIVGSMLSEIVKVCALDVPPPGVGLKTVTDAVPAVAMSEAGMAAVNCIAETNVVVRLDPFHCTTELLSKLLPFTVRVNAAPPAVAELGLKPLRTGTPSGVVEANVT